MAALDEDGAQKAAFNYEDLDGTTIRDNKAATLQSLSTEDLSLVTKFIILAVVVAACYAFVRSHGPRRTGLAGRHGAYEKGGLP